MYNLKIRLGDSVVCGVEVNASECHLILAHKTANAETADSATESSPAWHSCLEAALHIYRGPCGTEDLLFRKIRCQRCSNWSVSSVGA